MNKRNGENLKSHDFKSPRPRYLLEVCHWVAKSYQNQHNYMLNLVLIRSLVVM